MRARLRTMKQTAPKFTELQTSLPLAFGKAV